MFCNKCGNQINEGESFCNKCGEKVETTPPVETTVTESAPATQAPTQQSVEPVQVQQTPVQVQGAQEQPKKNNIVPIIIIIAVVFILFVVGIIIAIVAFFTVNKSSSSETTTTITTTTEETTTASSMDNDKKEYQVDVNKLDLTNISFKAEDDNPISNTVQLLKVYPSTSTSPELHITLNHTNSEPIDCTVYVNYYKDGVRIGSDYTIQDHIKPNKIALFDIRITVKEEFDSFDITYKTRKGDSERIDFVVNDKNYKALDVSKKSDKTNVGELTNNSNDKVYIEAACLRYKGNELVYVHQGFAFLDKPGEIADCKCYESNVPKNIEYDRTEFQVFSAYNPKPE